jgi:hypothetical protein
MSCIHAPAANHSRCGTATPQSASRKSYCGVRELQFQLQLGAGVRIDFAIQANFFKCRCGPLHDDFLVISSA